MLVPAPAHVPDALRHRFFRGSAAVHRGLLTPNQLRGPAWRRLFPDVYADRLLPVTHSLRARAAATFVVPGAVVTGPSAAVLWGVDLAGPQEDVELTVPAGSHPRRVPGLRVRRAALDEGQVQCRRGVLVTTPTATALRLAGSLSPDDAVVAVDRLLAAGLVDLAPLRSLAVALIGPNSARARRALDLADERSESPQETRLRLLLRRSGLPAPVPQYVVRDERGRHVARVDFAWPEQKVAVEYDGAWHAEPGQFAKDRARLNRLQAAGWRVVFVTAGDLRNPLDLAAHIAEALGQRGFVR